MLFKMASSAILLPFSLWFLLVKEANLIDIAMFLKRDFTSNPNRVDNKAFDNSTMIGI